MTQQAGTVQFVFTGASGTLPTPTHARFNVVSVP